MSSGDFLRQFPKRDVPRIPGVRWAWGNPVQPEVPIDSAFAFCAEESWIPRPETARDFSVPSVRGPHSQELLPQESLRLWASGRCCMQILCLLG